MSLAVLADHMASKGRGPDSMLIHMSPREVQGLQALAMKNGGSLTINPDTGLPEAGFLDKLLPTIIGAGLTLFGGVPPNVAAMIVGGIQTARTGDIGKGISAGLGAYGGAGLTQGLSAAGAGAIGSEAAGQSYLASAPGVLEGAGAGLSADMAANLTDAGVNSVGADAARQAAAGAVEAASPFDKISRGFDAVKANPMGYATKDNLKYLAAAAGPAIMAGENVQAKGPQTVTKPGMIRPYSYDPYGGTYTAGTPYETAPTKAADGGLMGMNSGGYSPGQLDFTQSSEPVMRMAEGGIAGYAPGGEIFDWFAKNQGKSDADIAAQMQAKDWTPEMIANATGTQNQLADYQTRFAKAVATPTTDASEFLAATKDVGLQNQGLASALQNTGMSQAAQYALTHELNDTGGIKGTNFYTDIGYTPGAQPGDKGGLEGLYSNINYAAQGLQNQIASGDMTGQEARRAAIAEMNRIGMSAGDLKAATGKTLAELFPDTKTVVTPPVVPPVVLPDPFKNVVPGETQMPGATVYDNGAFGNYGNNTGNPLTSTPGDIITNPDDTRTVTPNIPGRPYGGFPGVGAVKDAYTAGGGSLGVNKNLFVPKTLDELNARYKNTGGSKQAMDYLTGKTPYDPTPYTPTGEIQKPYWESVGRFPAQEKNKNKKYLFKNGKYELNPDFVEPSYVLAAKKAAAAKETAKTDAAAGKSINVLDAQGNNEPAYLRDDGFYYTSGGNKFDEKGAQVAAGGGLAALTMAGGGMSGQYDLGSYSDGGRLLRGPGDGVSDSIPATIGNKRPARLADGEFVVPARIVSELGNGSTEAGARKLYAMMDRVQAARKGSIGKGKVAKNSRADKYLPA